MATASRLLVGGAGRLAAVVAFFIFRDSFPTSTSRRSSRTSPGASGAWTYLLVGALAFLETGAFVGLVAPGEFTVLLGGAVAGQGDISLPLILAITWLAAFLGDSVSFMLGASLGRGFLVRHGERVRITESGSQQVESYFARYGGRTILIGRFIGLVRAACALHRRDAASCATGRSRRTASSAPGSGRSRSSCSATSSRRASTGSAAIVSRGSSSSGSSSGSSLAIVLRVPVPARAGEPARGWWRRWSGGALLRPILQLGRRLRPQVEFLMEAADAGRASGSSSRRCVAALSVGLFVLIAYWSVVAGDPGPTPGTRPCGTPRRTCRRPGWWTSRRW